MELGLAGFVRNEPDGSVDVKAEGGEGALNAFLRWLQEGGARPPPRWMKSEARNPNAKTTPHSR